MGKFNRSNASSTNILKLLLLLSNKNMFIENRLFFFSSQNTLRRTHDEAFPDDDDEWIFDPALDPVMVGGGAGTNPLLESDLQPVGARRNWRNALNKRSHAATTERQHPY